MKPGKVYRFYHDAGHGWLAVPIREVRALNVKISRYSYRKGGTVYLEEDCDAMKFERAYEKEMGEKLKFKEIYHDHNNTGQSIIRSYHEKIPADILEDRKEVEEQSEKNISMRDQVIASHEKRLEQLKERREYLEAEWERNVLFAGPAAPNRRLNNCLIEIRRIEEILENLRF